MPIEHKIFRFDIKEAKNDTANLGLGIIKGYASTYGNVDSYHDVIVSGAFDASLADYSAKNRTLKVYYQHDTYGIPLGGIRPENILSDKNGLSVIMEINTKVQLACEIYELVKQGVLSDMSIGFSVDDYEYKEDVRILKKLSLWEVSIVGEPANPLAKVTDVKNTKNNFYKISDLQTIKTKRDYERLLRDSGAFSKEAAIYLASHFVEKEKSDSSSSETKKAENGLAQLNELKQLLNKL